MKTTLACLGILMVAFLFGKVRGSRLEELKQRTSSSDVASRSKPRQRESPGQAPVYCSKYERTSSHASAPEVFQSVRGFLTGRTSTSTGDMASMTDRNKGALKQILQLDLTGIEELIAMISQSKDPILKINSAVKYEQISLCIIAMADQDPGHALDYVIHAKDKMNPSALEDRGTRVWLGYVLTRLGGLEPQRALDALVEISANATETLPDVRDILGSIARQDPGLVLDALDRMPETARGGMLESLTNRFDSDDQYTALFLAMREHFRSRPDEMKIGLDSLSRRFTQSQLPPAEVIGRVSGLGMSDAEKLLMSDRLGEINILPKDGKEYAVWFSKFIPKSPAGDHLIFKAIEQWGQVDETGARAFLKEQGIDPMEMIRIESAR